jgi:hypothetical protein
MVKLFQACGKIQEANELNEKLMKALAAKN